MVLVTVAGHVEDEADKGVNDEGYIVELTELDEIMDEVVEGYVKTSIPDTCRGRMLAVEQD